MPLSEVEIARLGVAKLIADAPASDDSVIPEQLKSKLDAWKWGSPGWISPANLILTAAWRKALFPEVDCRRIWARDAQGAPIAGSYSIRSWDESVTVPLFSELELTQGFCSSNSGMQGSRALEKARSSEALTKNMDFEQNTRWDFSLLAEIFDCLELLSSHQAAAAFQYLVKKATAMRDVRRSRDDEILASLSGETPLVQLLSNFDDPEFPKCVAAACLQILYSGFGLSVTGIEDHMTASDQRAEKPGDLHLLDDLDVIAAFEVKDKSRRLDKQHALSARQIVKKLPSIRFFGFILENPESVAWAIADGITGTAKRADGLGIPVIALGVEQLVAMASAVASDDSIHKAISRALVDAPSVKPSTKQVWLSRSTTQSSGKTNG